MSDYTPTTEEGAEIMNDYTPTTGEIRLLMQSSNIAFEVPPEGFDRWLTDVKAEAVIELVARIEAAVILLGDDDITPTGRRMISKVLNPYRQGEGSGNGASQSPVESSNLLNGENK